MYALDVTYKPTGIVTRETFNTERELWNTVTELDNSNRDAGMVVWTCRTVTEQPFKLIH